MNVWANRAIAVRADGEIVTVFGFRSSRTKDRVQRCRELCAILDAVFNRVQSLIRPGATTADLDDAAGKLIASSECDPMFKTNPRNNYPATITASVNDQVVNTIPSAKQLRSGDLLSLQIGIAKKGAFAYQAWTFFVEQQKEQDVRLWQAGFDALNNAVASIRTGSKVGDISFAIQSTLKSAGFEPGRDFVGNGIGDEPHVEPAIPCYMSHGRSQARTLDQKLSENQLLSINVFAHAGSHRTKLESDGWGVVSRDGSNSVHFSHIVAVTTERCTVLTSERSTSST